MSDWEGGGDLKKRVWMLLFAALVTLCAIAQAQPVSFMGLLVDSETTYVDFGDAKVTDIQGLMEFLDQLPQLEQADMYASRLSRADTELLFERYPDVFFGWTITLGDHRIRTDITAFSTLHNRSSDPHSSEVLSRLRYCKNLQALDVGHNAVTDISFLRELKNLRVLILGRNMVSDISVLAELPELEYLELFSNRIEDITPLRGLTKLKDLNLVNNRIKDISVLYEMDQLERVWTSMNGGISDEQIRQLRQALPACEIDDYSHPTGGTWREHPRYETIHEMFYSGRYIPFE